ncbi:MAG: hypothetical protein HKN22_07020 [Bacteroidia bacterium]|nr:hypothetical protein [Bacteroidia bacterium]
MSKAHDLYHQNNDASVVFSYKGVIDEDLMSEIFSNVEANIYKSDNEPLKSKKLYSIVVECLQNLFHHSSGRSKKNESENVVFLILKNDDNYQIITGNEISESSKHSLKKSIEEINKLDKEELREYYRERLESGDLSKKGGAGLGLIEMARKSGNKLQYEFDDLKSGNTFFTLIVTV